MGLIIFLFLLLQIFFISQMRCSPVDDSDPRGNDIRYFYSKQENRKNQSRLSPCDDCKFTVAEVINTANNSANLEKLKTFMKATCKYLNGSEVQECYGIVDNLNFFIQELQLYMNDPKIFCEDINLCGGAMSVQLYNSATLHLCKFIVRVGKGTGLMGDLLCNECMFVTNELNALLQDLKFQQKLKNQLEEACQHVPPSLQEECRELVEGYFYFTLKVIQELMSDASRFCSTLDFCLSLSDGNLPKYAIAAAIKEAFREIKLAPSSTELDPMQRAEIVKAICFTCQHNVHRFIETLKKRKNLIASKLGAVMCDLTMDDGTTNCPDISPLILNEIKKSSSRRICTKIGFCDKNTVINLPDESTICETCQTATEFFGSKLEGEAFQKQVVDTVKQRICPSLPADLPNECLKFTTDYLPKSMKWFARLVRDPQFCKDVSMCPEEMIQEQEDGQQIQ